MEVLTAVCLTCGLITIKKKGKCGCACVLRGVKLAFEFTFKPFLFGGSMVKIFLLMTHCNASLLIVVHFPILDSLDHCKLS